MNLNDHIASQQLEGGEALRLRPMQRVCQRRASAISLIEA